MTNNIAKTIYKKTIMCGGYSYSLQDLKEITTGYSVAVYPDLEKRIPVEEFTTFSILNYIHENHSTLYGVDDVFLGTWYNRKEGVICLDISKTFNNLEEAIATGYKYQQDAIFNHSKKQSIDL